MSTLPGSSRLSREKLRRQFVHSRVIGDKHEELECWQTGCAGYALRVASESDGETSS